MDRGRVPPRRVQGRPAPPSNMSPVGPEDHSPASNLPPTTRSLQARLRQGPPKLFLTQQITGPAPTRSLMVNQAGDSVGFGPVPASRASREPSRLRVPCSGAFMCRQAAQRGGSCPSRTPFASVNCAVKIEKEIPGAPFHVCPAAPRQDSGPSTGPSSEAAFPGSGLRVA